MRPLFFGSSEARPAADSPRADGERCTNLFGQIRDKKVDKV